MKAVIEKNNFVLAGDVETASCFFSRAKGLLGRKNLPAGRGLLIEKCNAIHMFFMRFAIDAVFLDSAGKAVYILRGFKPWRVSKIVSGAVKVLELPAGIAGNNLAPGDVIVFKE